MDERLLFLTRPSAVRQFLLLWMASSESFFENKLFSFSILLNPQTHIRPQGYHEEWLPRYVEYDFFQLFRLTEAGVQKLLQFIGPELVRRYCGGEEPISAEKKLLMGLWYLGKSEGYLSVADKFNISQSAAHRCINDVIDALVNLRSTFIFWPKGEEIAGVTNAFQARGNIAGVMGAIDVCNVHFKAPANQHDSYIDRKSNYSIKLQAICTADKVLTSILVGWPGSVHDSRILQNSKIFDEIVNNQNRGKYFPSVEHHLVGDSAYPLLDWILTPFRDNGNLAPWQVRYNYLLSKTRIVIEHTFGLLKARWRILFYINVNSVEKAVKIIVACCVLHNFCYLNGEEWNANPLIPEDDNIEEYDGPNEENIFAINKRLRIAQGLYL